MSEPESKPFDISKRLVWEAYRKVADNKGAAGVDRQSIAEFERDLKNNLFKLWNRMSSGSYFPPPVRAVEIPKKAGGVEIGLDDREVGEALEGAPAAAGGALLHLDGSA